jgi:hypothetical protein
MFFLLNDIFTSLPNASQRFFDHSASPAFMPFIPCQYARPKKPGVFIPFNSRPGEATPEDEKLWYKERDEYLDGLRSAPSVSDEQKQTYFALQKMSYQEFTALYLDDQPSGNFTPYGSGNVPVGHVGIIDIENETAFVIEAMPPGGVGKTPYDKWIKDRVGEIFWVARLKDISREDRAAVATAAKRQIGKPYKFWNFDLSDASSFYCSKLAWFAVFSVTGVSTDDNLNPKRFLWYSPKL